MRNKKLTNEEEKRIAELLIKGYSTKEITEKLNLCREVIRRRARLLGIKPFRGKSQFYKIKDCPNDLKQLIIGSLLGDGTFEKIQEKNGNSCLIIAHCKEQFEYLDMKYQILLKYSLINKITKTIYTDDRFKNPEYTLFKIKSRRNPIFTYIRNKCYIEGKKHLFFDIIEDIDEMGLAIWYMDDGYVTNNSCILSTCSFTKEEQLLLSYFLLGRFGLHFTVGKNDNSMYLLSSDFNKFRNIISPFILESMKYKLVPYKERVLNKQGELLEQPNRSISSQATEEHKSM